jgi:isoleucyl-tRNA synthetase
MQMVLERLNAWLAPILVFTMDEVWQERTGGQGCIHLEDMPETPATWRDDARAVKWAVVRRVRRVVTGALEVLRRDKVIGASLEAAPVVYVTLEVAQVLGTVPFDDLCITSGITVVEGDAPSDAFGLDDTADVAVTYALADGEKCLRCWKILPDVGSHKHAGTCARCDAALG